MENIKENEIIKIKKLNEDELKRKYGKVYKIEITLDELDKTFIFYFKAPHMASINRYLKNTSKRIIQSNIDFVKDNIIDEQGEEIEKVLKEYIGIAGNISGKLLGFIGFSDNIIAKKL